MTRPVVIAAGGTGGHMFPALALARALQAEGHTVALVTDARGARFVGKDIPHHLISAGSPSGTLAARLRGIASLLLGTVQSFVLFGRLRPVAAACFGGYASVPPAVAAGLRRLPLLVHEQNAVFGKANRLIARFASTIALTFESTSNAPKGAHVVTGNPVRPDFAAPQAAAHTGDEVRLLVMGGSQGARVLSDVVPAALAALPPALRARVRLAQQCRPEDLERVRAALADAGIDAELASFFDDIPRRMAAADLVVTRAGASTIAELLQLGKPAILVPFKYAADDHQRANAVQLERAGAAIAVDQDAFTPALLARHLEALLAEPGRLAAMAAASRGLARPDAAQALAGAVLSLLPPEISV